MLNIEPYSHIVTHLMKTTLKAVVEHALRREISPQENLAADSPYEAGPFGILSLKKRTEGLTAERGFFAVFGG
jgi:hypothetical protein